MTQVGFIGLGRMGLPMARNLVAAGYRVRAFDIAPANLEAAAQAGIEPAGSHAGVATGAGAIITMLPAGGDVLQVYESSGTLAAASPATLFIDCSTIDVASAKRAHALAGEAGMLSLDAPVSGGIAGAEAGTLTFMAGGSGEAFERGRALLAAMGKRIVHCGAAGTGQIAKMCNQMMVAINMVGVAEAFVLAERLGLEPKVLFDVVSSSSGGSWALANYVPVPGLVATSAAERSFRPGFTTDLMVKDLKIFQEAAREAGSASPVGALAAALYDLFRLRGNGGLDYSAIIQLIRGGGSAR
jgi:3-hydroxyisobutyrate dehydrogenase